MNEHPLERRQRQLRELEEHVKQTRQRIAEARARVEEVRLEVQSRTRRVLNAVEQGERGGTSSEQ